MRGRRRTLFLFACSCLAVSAHAQTPAPSPGPPSLSGRVLDARTGEPIAKALVSVRDLGVQTVTDAAGGFEIPRVPDGRCELYVSTVGYGLVERTVEVSGPTRVTVFLGQEAIKRSDEVSVIAGVFDPQEKGAIAEHTLDNTELRNLASVMADDPLRSVQTLPGAVTGDDFNGTFSVRGSGFETVGLYVDGVLTSSPFHTIRDVNAGYSLTILNGDVVQGVSLISSAPPARFGDRVGAALSIETRDGSREKRFTRVHLGAAGVSLWSEGPIGKSNSWLVGARKSFLDYVINRIEEDPSFVVGYYDVQAKLSRRTARHHWSLFLLHGHSVWRDETPSKNRNSEARANAGTQIASARWCFTPSDRTVLVGSASLTRETADNGNSRGEPLFGSNGRQAGLRGDLVHTLGGAHTLEAGLQTRRITESARELFFERNRVEPRSAFDYVRVSWQPSAYVQDTWAPRRGRLALTLGGRWDRSTVSAQGLLLPRASVTFALTPRSKVSAAAGGYSQFPSLARLFGAGGNPRLRAERSRQYTVAFEHLVGERLRVRAEVYDHEDSARLYVPNGEFRRSAGRIVPPRADAVSQNSLSGRSRGFEVLVQRRTANGLSGWLSYAHGRTRVRDAVTGEAFPSDFDQRHTFNAYASLRLTDRFNLSTKYRYGSNIPIAGFYAADAAGYTLAEDRNLLRVPAYSRLDVRASRAFFFKHSKLTLYAEVANVLNRTHYRYTDVSVDGRTGRVVFDRDTLFPLLPAAGMTIEF